MEIKVYQGNGWDELLRTLTPAPSFLQSQSWGSVLESEGKTISRLVIEENNKTILAAQVVMNAIPLGKKYLFIPGGPVGSLTSESVATLKTYAQKQGAIFLRLEPASSSDKVIKKLERVHDVNPSTTTVLSLDKTFEQIEGVMDKKTRSSLRRSRESNLTIVEKKDVGVLMSLLALTSQRDDFRTHHKAHYEAVLKSPEIIQFIAYQDNVAVATAVCALFQPTITYLFAASDHTKRDFAAPYALQEAIIKYGLAHNFKYYDMFGIAPRIASSSEYTYDPKHSYAGITQFKIRFGGRIIERPGTFDLIVSPFKYRLYQLMRKIRRLV